jgi:hypothetical protein
MAAAAIHWGTLLQVVWVSLLCGIGMSAIFSLVILASARATEASRASRDGAAAGFVVLAVLALLAFGVAITFGVHVMLSK